MKAVLYWLRFQTKAANEFGWSFSMLSIRRKPIVLLGIAFVFLALIFQPSARAIRDQQPHENQRMVGRHKSFEVNGESSKTKPQIYQEPAPASSVQPSAGLTVNATFDTTITSNPNAAAIEAMINNAIGVLQSQFSDPITVSNLFRYSTADPKGQPLGSGTLALSVYEIDPIPWTTYINALKADAKTANDATANASLPGSPLSTNVLVSSANGRAIGLNTPGHLDSSEGFTGSLDGIITLNSSQNFQFSRPPGSNIDAQRTTEHEMDEVLGLGSFIGQGNDLHPQDLFSWSTAGTRNTTSSGTRYFSIDGGTTNIVNFNQNPSGDFGDWLSGTCPQATPYVQNAFSCVGQVSDVSATSPEGINLDVIGYDLVTASSQIQFSSSSYSVNESGPRVNIGLTRTGDTTGSSSVSYQTIDSAGLQDCAMKNGIASPRCDYEMVVGTLTFAAGETSKSFSVAIIDDSYGAEGNETFTVSLNNPSGATLGAQSTATVTINDNDGAVDGPNPIDQTTFFVRQHYLDFLGREPDPGGFAAWVSIINGCAPGDTSCDRIHVSQNFFQSEEFQTRGYFIYRFYPVSFPNVPNSDPPGYGHKPDYAQFMPDLARVSGFLDANQLEAAKVAFIADFMARPAFVARYPSSMGNTTYVDTLLGTAQVTVSASTRQGWIDGLNTGSLTRAVVLRQIVESNEVFTKYNNPAFVIMQYFGYLRRDPDGAYPVWIQVLNSTGDSRGMITGFVNSVEYRHRFGP